MTSRQCVSAVAALLLLPAFVLAQQDDSWAGKKIMTKRANVKIGFTDDQVLAKVNFHFGPGVF